MSDENHTSHPYMLDRLDEPERYDTETLGEDFIVALYPDADFTVMLGERGVCIDLNEDPISQVQEALDLSDEQYQQVKDYLEGVLD